MGNRDSPAATVPASPGRSLLEVLMPVVEWGARHLMPEKHRREVRLTGIC